MFSRYTLHMPRPERAVYVKITTVQTDDQDRQVIRRTAKELGVAMPRVVAALVEAWKNCSQTVRDQAIVKAINRNKPAHEEVTTDAPAQNGQVAA